MMTITDYANAALDAAYVKSAGGMLAQVKALTTAQNSQMQRQLAELNSEAARLAESGERMKADNAVFEKTLRVLAVTFTATAAIVFANDDAIQASGQGIAVTAVTAKIFSQLAGAVASAGKNPISDAARGYYAKQLASMGVNWNFPTALDFATNYVASEAWVNRLNGWGAGYADLVGKTVLQGLKDGWSPLKTADYVTQIAVNMPYHAAENITRTLQLTAYRSASAAMDLINGRYIEYKIRIARLDDRTCLTCIALHGTKLKPGERVDDHYRGRCSEWYKVPGGDDAPKWMQADSTPGNRRFVPYKTGEEWFNALPEGRQKAQRSFINSPAKWRAFRSGIPLSEFVGEYNDDIFGRQAIEKSLKAALGERAKEFYVNVG